MEPVSPELKTDLGVTVDLAPPPSVNLSLWRSLWQNLRDRLLPEALPPLQLTSKPVEVGMLVADQVTMPWYRTIFTNLGDVVAPETLPPLELESRPIEVDELIGDQIERGWWTSLLRNLADRVAPEKQPPLHLTSAPVKLAEDSTQLTVPRWSALIDAPKMVGFDTKGAPPAALPPIKVAPPTLGLPGVQADLPTDSASLHELVRKAKRTLQISYLREAFWIVLAGAEVVILLFWFFVPK